MNFSLLSARLFGEFTPSTGLVGTVVLPAAVYPFNLVHVVLVQFGPRALEQPVVKLVAAYRVLAGGQGNRQALYAEVEPVVLAQAPGVFRGGYSDAPKKAGWNPAGAELVPGELGFIQNRHPPAGQGQIAGAGTTSGPAAHYYNINVNLRVVLAHCFALRTIFMGATFPAFPVLDALLASPSLAAPQLNLHSGCGRPRLVKTICHSWIFRPRKPPAELSR